MQQTVFKSVEQYKGFRTRWRNLYKLNAQGIKDMKSILRSPQYSEKEKRVIMQTLDTAKCAARSLMMALDATKLQYSLDKAAGRVQLSPKALAAQEARMAERKAHGADLRAKYLAQKDEESQTEETQQVQTN